MTPAPSGRSTGTVVTVLTTAEAAALVRLGSMLEDELRKDSPINTGTLKLDEQSAAQMRDAYDEAKDELQDRLGFLYQHDYDALDFDTLARAVVDRIMGLYK